MINTVLFSTLALCVLMKGTWNYSMHFYLQNRSSSCEAAMSKHFYSASINAHRQYWLSKGGLGRHVQGSLLNNLRKPLGFLLIADVHLFASFF